MTTLPDPADAVPPALRDAVLAWYDAGGRALAFRATRDPYAVLVSELMAQQTQAARAAEAWTAWMARYPTVDALAEMDYPQKSGPIAVLSSDHTVGRACVRAMAAAAARLE